MKSRKDKLVNALYEEVHSKSIGQIGIDSGSFVIVDPGYIDKQNMFKANQYRQGEYVFKPPNGKGVYINGSSTGGDGTFEVIARYDTEGEFPKSPYEIVIKLREAKQLKEDTLYHDKPWDKDVHLRIDNDEKGGYLELRLNGEATKKFYIISKDEIATWKKRINGNQKT